MRKFDLCIYHGNCTDGFGAACSVHKFHNGNIQFHGESNFSNPPPDVTGLDVVIVDFSYKRNVLIEMAGKAKSIVILDHHATAINDLVDLPKNCTTVFDLKRSGALITYEYFFPNTRVPKVIQQISDRDLFTFKIRGSEEVHLALYSLGYEFSKWMPYLFPSNPSHDVARSSSLMQTGTPILRKHKIDVREYCNHASIWDIDGYDVPVISTMYTHGTDTCALLCKGHPFAMYFYFSGDSLVMGFRSDKTSTKSVDVAKLAQKLGGGGHVSASGCRLPKKYLYELSSFDDIARYLEEEKESE